MSCWRYAAKHYKLRINTTSESLPFIQSTRLFRACSYSPNHARVHHSRAEASQATPQSQTDPRAAARIRAGLGFVSEDRKGEGLAQSMSIADNLTLSNLHTYTRGGLLQLKTVSCCWPQPC